MCRENYCYQRTAFEITVFYDFSTKGEQAKPKKKSRDWAEIRGLLNYKK